MNKAKGFTLIELMIVVVVIGIISMIALPSFQDSMRKGKRSDAKTSLLDGASRMEQYYLDNKTYTTSLANVGLGTNSSEGYYALSVKADPGNCPIASCYVLVATAQAGGQTEDSGCTVLEYSSVGTKSPTSCW